MSEEGESAGVPALPAEVARLVLEWRGPFSWPGFEESAGLPTIPREPGVYLQTFSCGTGFAIYGAGITKRDAATRFREHTRKYLNGEYNVLSVPAGERGIRDVIWRGWGYARAHRDEFETRRNEIQDAARSQMSAFKLFLADPDVLCPGVRLRERLEVAVMNCLYAQPSPLCDLPDTGMFLARRRMAEAPVIVENVSRSQLHGLPRYLEL